MTAYAPLATGVVLAAVFELLDRPHWAAVLVLPVGLVATLTQLRKDRT